MVMTGVAGAQEFRQSVTSPRTTAVVERPAASGKVDLKLRTEGVIPRMVRSGAPLQMINPKAKPEYGDGKDLVQDDPSEKAPKGALGFRLFVFQY